MSRRLIRFGELDARELEVLVEGLRWVSLELGRSAPAPRGAPFYGLDLGGVDPQSLDGFWQSGIFRKYERVLAVGCGLGGATRWWAARAECSVVGIDRRLDLVRAAQRLSSFAGEPTPRFVVASGHSLPFAAAHFTHAWLVATPLWGGEEPEICRELRRVLRARGELVVQLVRLSDVDLWRRTLAITGWEVEKVRQVTVEEAAAFPAAARECLRRYLRSHPVRTGPRVVRFVETMLEVRSRLVIQVFARCGSSNVGLG